jgi:16S rRNA processing protein RimM
MNIDECFELGYVIKPHGLNGAVDIFLDTDFPGDYKNLESVFVHIGQKLVPFFIRTIRINGNKALVQLEGIDSIDQAEGLKGSKLLLPESMLPELGDKDFYFHELLGFEVTDVQHGMLGIVERFYDYPGQTLLGINHKGKEVLIPINDDIILNLDKEKKLIDVDLPDGLLDVYINS